MNYAKYGTVHRGIATEVDRGTLTLEVNSLQQVPVNVTLTDTQGVPMAGLPFTGRVITLACEKDLLMRAIAGYVSAMVPLYHPDDAPETEDPVDCMACIAAGET